MTVTVNGQALETGARSLFALVPDHAGKVVILNGFKPQTTSRSRRATV